MPLPLLVSKKISSQRP